MKTILFLMLIINIQLIAQTNNNNNFDITKTYLSQIQEAVDYAPNTMNQKINNLKHVIEQGKHQRNILEKQLQKTKSEKEQREIIRDFNFILQSVIMLNTDIQKNFPVSSEINYLNQNIPLLLKKL